MPANRPTMRSDGDGMTSVLGFCSSESVEPTEKARKTAEQALRVAQLAFPNRQHSEAAPFQRFCLGRVPRPVCRDLGYPKLFVRRRDSTGTSALGLSAVRMPVPKAAMHENCPHSPSVREIRASGKRWGIGCRPMTEASNEPPDFIFDSRARLSDGLHHQPAFRRTHDVSAHDPARARPHGTCRPTGHRT